MTIDTAPLVIGMAWLGALTAWIVATTGATREALRVALQELKEKLHLDQ